MTLHTLLIAIARAAIESRLGLHETDVPEDAIQAYPQLNAPRACFITLKLDGTALRGCIGSIIPHRALIDDVKGNAVAAAFEDPRFAPLRAQEYRRCSVEVSLLSVPETLSYADEEALRQHIRPGIDGVILRFGGRSATFLPQVWEELPDFDRFFAHLGLKAGLGENVLAFHPDIQTYQAEHFEDPPLEGGAQ